MLKLKERDNNKILKKILVYGRPGHGKSSFASQYCKENGLKPIVLDIDDTNFTGDDIVELDMDNDLKTYNNVKKIIKDTINSEYDTIIIDGLGSLLELLVSSAPGQKKFLDRAERFKTIFNELKKSNKNLIFIGQEDCNMDSYTENLPNRSIITINSIVNEIYHCVLENNVFTHKTDKFRKELNKEMNTVSKLNNPNKIKGKV